jgi:hypothetical protein
VSMSKTVLGLAQLLYSMQLPVVVNNSSKLWRRRYEPLTLHHSLSSRSHTHSPRI